MKFELLPNEILIECFEYLDIFDTFYSFDQLNYRFYKLIRNIPLHLNFQHVRKRKFDRFCQLISSGPNIKQQIYSLRLSNKDTCGQIKSFLSCFTPNEFSHIDSLTLIHVEQENLAQLRTLLPSSKLFSFHLISSQIHDAEIVSGLPISNLRKLSLLTIPSFLNHSQQPTLITHLIISLCSLEQLFHQLFQYVPLLKYLNIAHVTNYDQTVENNTIINAVHLKKLIIGQFNYTFADFANFAKQTQNLQSLTISADGHVSMINANQWENLITSSLPYLDIFKFKFKVSNVHANIIPSSLKQFHSEFWVQQHYWYTELLLQKQSCIIYTTPYKSNYFILQPFMKKLWNKFVDNSNTFDKVTNLELNLREVEDKSSFRFSNVISLEIFTYYTETNKSLTQTQNIEYLKMIVNLSHLKHLDISRYQRSISSGELLIILKESPQLSSITIVPNDLILLYNDNELCQYLNKMIKKLVISKSDDPSFSNIDELTKFCIIFSNIEQLICNINQPRRILFLLYRLSNLSTIHISLSLLKDRQYFASLFLKKSRELNFEFRLKCNDMNVADLFIWRDKNVN